MPELIREAIRQDGRSMYQLWQDSGVNSAVLLRFMAGERDMNLRTADKVCQVLGLELRPIRKCR